MKLPPHPEPPLLDESGLTITFTHIAASGTYCKWRNLGIVRIERRGDPVTGALNPTFSLVISTKRSPIPFFLFKTQDAELAKRIEDALDTVAKRFGVPRET